MYQRWRAREGERIVQAEDLCTCKCNWRYRLLMLDWCIPSALSLDTIFIVDRERMCEEFGLMSSEALANVVGAIAFLLFGLLFPPLHFPLPFPPLRRARGLISYTSSCNIQCQGFHRLTIIKPANSPLRGKCRILEIVS